MSTFSGLAVGIVGLAVLDNVLKNSAHASTLIEVPTGILTRWLDPFTPLIPQIAKTGNTGAAYTGGATASPV